MNTSKKPQRRWFSLLLAGTVVATVCTGGVKAKGPFTPTFEIVACPERVTAEEASTVSCAYLTVLQNRTVSNGRTIRLFVTRAEPVEGNPPPDPMFGAGPLSAERDLGWSHPERVVGSRAGRVLFSMDVRGTGYSEPNLSCPEIEQLTDPSTGITFGTREMETAFLSAVQACHNRLTAEGIDLASYNLEAMAGDAEDLRTTLGIDDWNLITWGTTSSISFEIMRRYPQHIRSVAMDSPMAPQLDQFTQAVVGTEWAFGQVVQACKARPACREAFPHLHAAWREALRGLDDHPSEILDEDLEIVVDDATAVRQLRNNLAVGGHTSCFLSCGLDTFPLAVYDLREHGWANGGPAGRLVEWSGAPPFHVGYDIQWWPSVFVPEAELSEGLTYSHLCHDEVPFIDQAALAEAAGGRPWYVDAYVHSPYPQICERWHVGQAETDPHEPLVTAIPVMMFVGTMDPFSPLPPLKDDHNRRDGRAGLLRRRRARDRGDDDLGARHRRRCRWQRLLHGRLQPAGPHGRHLRDHHDDRRNRESGFLGRRRTGHGSPAQQSIRDRRGCQGEDLSRRPGQPPGPQDQPPRGYHHGRRKRRGRLRGRRRTGQEGSPRDAGPRDARRRRQPLHQEHGLQLRPVGRSGRDHLHDRGHRHRGVLRGRRVGNTGATLLLQRRRHGVRPRRRAVHRRCRKPSRPQGGLPMRSRSRPVSGGVIADRWIRVTALLAIGSVAASACTTSRGEASSAEPTSRPSTASQTGAAPSACTPGSGIITTVAGSWPYEGADDQGYPDWRSWGDGGSATQAQLDLPSDVAVDALGNLYILETSHGVGVENVDPQGCVSPGTAHSWNSSTSSGDSPVSTTTVWSLNEHHLCSILSDRSRGHSSGSVYHPSSSCSKSSW